MDSQSEQFSALYDQYIEKIYRFVFLKVNSQETAEDITSKVFLNAWKAYKEPGKKIENAGAFLYRAAGNAVVDFYRSKDRARIISQDAVAEAVDSKMGLHDKAVLNADISLIKNAIQKLGKEYQDIIIWHYLEGIPIAEIAQMAGRPAGTIRVMLHRGLKDLKDMVQQA